MKIRSICDLYSYAK